MIRAIILWLMLATAAIAAPDRLSTSGGNILDPSGTPIILRGYNENYNTATATNTLSTDPAAMIAQGANVVRIRIGFLNRKTCGDPLYPPDSAEDAYNPSSTGTGFVDPTIWAPVYQQVLDASNASVAAGKPLWIMFATVGLNCTGDDTDATVISATNAAWAWIAGQLKNLPGIGAYELVAEPNQGFTQTDLNTFQTGLITTIRAVDPTTPIMVGPTPVYNARYISYLGAIANIIYTVDMYEPGPYVNQVLNGTTCPSASCFAYPGIFKDRPFLNASPCTFSLMGVTPGYLVYINRAWMDSLITCETAFRTANNVPVWVNQFGAYNIQPGSNTWTADMANALTAAGIGAAKWDWRQDHNTTSYGNGNALFWQAADLTQNQNLNVYNLFTPWLQGHTVATSGRR